MARKVTLDIPDDEEKEEAPSVSSAQTPSRAPALSGMARSLQDAAQSSIQEISTDLIDDSEYKDRLTPDDEEEIKELAESIDKQGQLIPILISPEGRRYRVIYGRRRLAALRLIGKPAKALIRSLDEDQAILAQGQENSFRKDLSWIEKALFARSLLDSGKDEGLVCDALNIDQKARRSEAKLTGLARMKQVTSCIPVEIIEAIGPASGVGRDRWYAAAKSFEGLGFPAGNQNFAATLLKSKEDGKSSDERFVTFEAMLRRQKPPSQSAVATDYGSVKITKRNVVITVKSSESGLHAWICENPEAALAALAAAREADKGTTIETIEMDGPRTKLPKPTDGNSDDSSKLQTTTSEDLRRRGPATKYNNN